MAPFKHLLVDSSCNLAWIGPVFSVRFDHQIGLLWFLDNIVVATLTVVVAVELLEPFVGQIATGKATDKRKRPKGVDPELAFRCRGQCVTVKVDARALIEQLKDTVSDVQQGNDPTGSVGNAKEGFVGRLTKNVVPESVGAGGKVGIVAVDPAEFAVAEQVPESCCAPGKTDNGLDGEESRQNLNVEIEEKVAWLAVVLGGSVAEGMGVRDEKKQDGKDHCQTCQQQANTVCLHERGVCKLEPPFEFLFGGCQLECCA